MDFPNDELGIPNPIVTCAGCENDLNTLNPHLTVAVKPVRKVLVANELPSDDPNEVGDGEIFLGKKSGRGVQLAFCNFECGRKWFSARKELKAKLEFHAEDEIYEPADNRSPEELVEAGELPKEILALHEAMAAEATTQKGDE